MGLRETTEAVRAIEQAKKAKRHATTVLVLLCTAQMLLSIDFTVVNVANASIERALGFTSANLQWTLTTYALTYGGFLLLGGRLADLFGRKRLFITGITAFACASIAAGASQNTVEFLSARAAQGFCAALISPSILALLARAFPDGPLRRRAYASWASAGAVGGIVGYVVGGLITTELSWRWIFFVNGPVAVLTLIGAATLLPSGETPGRRPRLDVPGAVSVTAGLALIIFGTGEAQSTSWGSLFTIVPLSIAPVLLCTFFLIEAHTVEPLVPLGLLRRRAAVGNVIASFQNAVMISTGFLAQLFMQQVWGFSAAKSGIAMLPILAGYILGARLSSRFASKVGARQCVVIGFALSAAGMIGAANTSTASEYFTLFAPTLFARSVGQGLAIVVVVNSVTSGVRKEDQGITAGIYNMSQQLGSAVGLALITMVAAAATAGVGTSIATHSRELHAGFLVCAAVAMAACIIAGLVLKAPTAERDNTISPVEDVLVSADVLDPTA